MTPSVTNLFEERFDPLQAEETIPLLQGAGFRLERLVSHGQASPAGFWYDQPEEEWVILLRGTATLDFGDAGTLDLRAGDSLKIPAHAKHRVDKVSEDALWLALHFRERISAED